MHMIIGNSTRSQLRFWKLWPQIRLSHPPFQLLLDSASILFYFFSTPSSSSSLPLYCLLLQFSDLFFLDSIEEKIVWFEQWMLKLHRGYNFQQWFNLKGLGEDHPTDVVWVCLGNRRAFGFLFRQRWCAAEQTLWRFPVLTITFQVPNLYIIFPVLVLLYFVRAAFHSLLLLTYHFALLLLLFII